MKLPFSLLLAVILLVPLSATVANDAVGKEACELVQDSYDACPSIQLPGGYLYISPLDSPDYDTVLEAKPELTETVAKADRLADEIAQFTARGSDIGLRQRQRMPTVGLVYTNDTYYLKRGTSSPIFHLLFCSIHRKNACAHNIG